MIVLETAFGEVTEWFKVTVLKTVVGQLTASSNLALSAIKDNSIRVIFLFSVLKYQTDNSLVDKMSPQSNRLFQVTSLEGREPLADLALW